MTATIRCYSPTPYPKPLPPGTRVKRIHGGQRGTVSSATTAWTRFGLFVVDYDNHGTGRITEIVGRDDVLVIQ